MSSMVTKSSTFHVYLPPDCTFEQFLEKFCIAEGKNFWKPFPVRISGINSTTQRIWINANGNLIKSKFFGDATILVQVHTYSKEQPTESPRIEFHAFDADFGTTFDVYYNQTYFVNLGKEDEREIRISETYDDDFEVLTTSGGIKEGFIRIFDTETEEPKKTKFIEDAKDVLHIFLKPSQVFEEFISNIGIHSGKTFEKPMRMMVSCINYKYHEITVQLLAKSFFFKSQFVTIKVHPYTNGSPTCYPNISLTTYNQFYVHYEKTYTGAGCTDFHVWESYNVDSFEVNTSSIGTSGDFVKIFANEDNSLDNPSEMISGQIVHFYLPKDFSFHNLLTSHSIYTLKVFKKPLQFMIHSINRIKQEIMVQILSKSKFFKYSFVLVKFHAYSQRTNMEYPAVVYNHESPKIQVHYKEMCENGEPPFHLWENYNDLMERTTYSKGFKDNFITLFDYDKNEANVFNQTLLNISPAQISADSIKKAEPIVEAVLAKKFELVDQYLEGDKTKLNDLLDEAEKLDRWINRNAVKKLIEERLN
jgi:hypothetical protein